MRIEGSTFLITGGASGLGAGTARLLAQAGANVVLGDMNAHAGGHLAAELGERARFVSTDVTDEGQVQAVVDLARRTFGRLDGAINCAGIVLGERVLGRSGPHRLESFRRVIEVNVIGTFNTVRLAAAAMANNPAGESGERGVIVNTASVAAFDGQIGQAAYAASKGAVASMTLPLARELARSGIRVVTIAPGIFDTAMVGGFDQALKDSLAAQVPFPARLGRPDEYAALVRQIIENQMLNGATIRLDGAIRMAPK
ncbi:MAG: SDR family NAD(P)-dependent oxidoreductase [Burkholderiales bacterium]|nr:SDR family NAD(P)-dependent oxidoreductase [Burkholderiales bacterium]